MSDTMTVPVYRGGPKCGEVVPLSVRDLPRALLPSASPRHRHAYVRTHENVYQYHGEVDVT